MHLTLEGTREDLSFGYITQLGNYTRRWVPLKDLETGGSQKDLEFAGASEQLTEERPYGDFPRRTSLGTKGKAKEDEDFATRPPGQLSAVAQCPTPSSCEFRVAHHPHYPVREGSALISFAATLRGAVQLDLHLLVSRQSDSTGPLLMHASGLELLQRLTFGLGISSPFFFFFKN